MNELKKLYEEAMERLEWLESEPKSDVINGRILELNNIIVKIQQILLSNIK